jgi:hypothetical protein
MDRHERRLIAFLAGDLDEDAARAWDEHLLDCERCWSAVRADRLGRAAAVRLQESAPAGLADRIRLAVELAEPPRRSRRGRTVLAAAMLVAAAALAALVVLLPSPRAGEPPTIAAVLQSAQRLPAGGSAPVDGTATSGPVLVGEPTTVAAGDAHLVLSHYRVGDRQVLLARSDRDFPTPDGARPVAGDAMTWTARRGRLTLYCPDPRVIVVAAVPATELPSLAGRLPLR